MDDKEYDKGYAPESRDDRIKYPSRDIGRASSLGEYIALAQIPSTKLPAKTSPDTIAAYRYVERRHVQPPDRMDAARDLFRQALTAEFQSTERDYALADILIARLLELDFGGKLTYGILAAITAILNIKKRTGDLPDIDQLHVNFVANEVTFLKRGEVAITTEYGGDMSIEDNVDEQQLNELAAGLDELAEQGDALAETRTVEQIWSDASATLMGVTQQFESFIERYSQSASAGQICHSTQNNAKPLDKIDRIAVILSNWEDAVQELCDLFAQSREMQDAAQLGDDFWEAIEQIIEKADIEAYELCQSQIGNKNYPNDMSAGAEGKLLTLEKPQAALQAVMDVRERMTQAREHMTCAVIKAMIEGDKPTSEHLTTLMMRRCDQRLEEIVFLLQQQVAETPMLNAGQWTAKSIATTITPAGRSGKRTIRKSGYQKDLWSSENQQDLQGLPDTLRG